MRELENVCCDLPLIIHWGKLGESYKLIAVRWVKSSSIRLDRDDCSAHVPFLQSSETVEEMGIPVCLGPKGPMKLMSWPYFVQGSYQKLRSSPFPGSIKVHWIAICPTARICLNNHVWVCFGFICQMLSSFMTFWWIQATHTDSVLNSSSQRSLIVQVVFQSSRFLRPKPPPGFGWVTLSHATLATYLPSSVPFHIKALHILSIAWMTSLGKTNAAHQKFVIPAMTVDKSTCLPAKDKYFDVHELIFGLTCCRRGSQLAVDNFLELSGRPRYRMGREPTGIPVMETMEVVSSSDNPLGKKHDFSTLMASPEKALNSSRTWRTPWTELEEPSVNMRISSAKHKWVRHESWQLGVITKPAWLSCLVQSLGKNIHYYSKQVRGERVALAQSSGAIEKSMEPPIDVNREGRCRITGWEPPNIQVWQVERLETGC